MDLKDTIAQNLKRYRKAAGLTQSELAEKINYSDKAVSKWERADGLPDAEVLKKIADIFGVSVDDLMNENPVSSGAKRKINILTKTNVTVCSVLLVWLVATVVFALAKMIAPSVGKMWLAFVYGVPASAIVLLVFNCIWGKHYFFIPIVSVLIWSAAAALFLTIPSFDAWLLFIICIPLEILTVIYFALRGKNKKNFAGERKRKRRKENSDGENGEAK